MHSGFPCDQDQPYPFDVTIQTGTCLCEQPNYFINLKAAQSSTQAQQQQPNEIEKVIHNTANQQQQHPLSSIDKNVHGQLNTTQAQQQQQNEKEPVHNTALQQHPLSSIDQNVQQTASEQQQSTHSTPNQRASAPALIHPPLAERQQKATQLSRMQKKRLNKAKN